MRIAVLNYADVANFGDVLFPFIARRELQARLPDARIEFFSPTEFACGDFESAQYGRELLAEVDAILLCGGEIVHREDGMLRRIYDRLGRQSIERPTDIVFDWADLPVRFKAWIGIGVPVPSPEVTADIRQASAHLDMIVARGEGSRARLLACGAPADRLETGPDLGWLIPRVLNSESVASTSTAPSTPYAVVHAMPQLTLPGYLEAAAEALKVMQDDLGVQVLGLPLTTCWGDEETLERLGYLGRDQFQIADYRLDVFTKAAILARSAFYLGQSMHGFITTLAAGRPAGLVYPDLDDKFRELLDYLDAREWRTDDWRSVSGLADRLGQLTTFEILRRQEKAVAGVDAMFDRLARRLQAAAMSSVR